MGFDDMFNGDQDFDDDEGSFGIPWGKYENLDPAEFIKSVNKYLISVQALESPATVRAFYGYINDIQTAIGNLEKRLKEVDKSGEGDMLLPEFLKEALLHSRIFYNTFLHDLTKVEYTEEEHETAKRNMESIDENLDRIASNLKKCKKLATVVDQYLNMRANDSTVSKVLDDSDCKNLLGTFSDLNVCVGKLEESIGGTDPMNRENILRIGDTAERSDDLLAELKESVKKINPVLGASKRRGSIKDKEKALKTTKKTSNTKRKTATKKDDKPTAKPAAKRRKKADL